VRSVLHPLCPSTGNNISLFHQQLYNFKTKRQHENAQWEVFNDVGCLCLSQPTVTSRKLVDYRYGRSMVYIVSPPCGSFCQQCHRCHCHSEKKCLHLTHECTSESNSLISSVMSQSASFLLVVILLNALRH